MISIAHPLADIFLLGFNVACSLFAGLYFLRFWKSTKDILFLAFATFFVVQGSSYAVIVKFSHPNEGSFGLFLVRLLSVLVVLGAILQKNFGKR